MLLTPQVVFPLLSLPNVVVHHLVSFLDPETKLFLGATCTFLAKIVAKKALAKNAALLSTMLEELPTMSKAVVQVNFCLQCALENLDKWQFSGSNRCDKLWPGVYSEEVSTAVDPPNRCQVITPCLF